MEHRRPVKSSTLERVLLELPTTATDGLIAQLQLGKCLSSARLVCKALCGAIDGSIRAAKFNVKDQQVELWRAGHCAPLARFTCCTSVDVSASYTSEADVSFPTLLALPFTGLPLIARRRITSVTISSIYSEPDTHVAEGHIMMSLAVLLPALRYVDLAGLCSLKPRNSWEPRVDPDPIQQLLMYDALATLPCLERLSVPYGSGLEHVGQLEGTLKHLRICVYLIHDVFTEGAVAAIVRLRHLEHLQIDGFDLELPANDNAAGGIRLLLQRVGALGGSLTSLHVHLAAEVLHDALSPEAMASISRLQRLRHLTLKPCCLTEGDLELIPGGGPRGVLPRLLACLPPSLEEVNLEAEFREPDEEFNEITTLVNIDICGGSCRGVTVKGGYYPAETIDLALVTKLLLTSCRACQGGGLGWLHVESLSIADDDWPQQLQHLQGVLRRCSSLQVRRLRVRNARDALAAVEVLGKPEALINTRYMDTLLRMRQAEEPHKLRQRDGAAEELGEDALSLRQPASLIVASDVAKAVMQRLTTKGPASRFLLLRGSLLVTLAKLQGDFLDSFIRSIKKQVPSLRAYQLLPAAVAAASKGALMLEAGREPGEADAVLLAVRDVAAKLEPGALEVVPLQKMGWLSFCSRSNYAKALEPELQALWDDVAARRRVGEREWLRQLLGLWDQLGDMPPPVSV